MAKEIITEKDIIEAGNLELLSKHVVEGFITGLHKSPYHGFSVEFAEHRQYNTGESTRYIDWKLFAKTNKLFVKKFEEETNLRCQLILDTTESMYAPENGLSKIRFAAVAAASISMLLKKQRDAVGLTTVNQAIEHHIPPKNSLLNQKQILETLNSCLNKKTNSAVTIGNLAANLHILAETLHKRSLLILFSDLLDNSNEELFDALRHLKYNKHDVIIFHVTDKKLEDEFDLPKRPLILIDSETKAKVKIHTNAVKESYLAALKAFKQDIKVKCAQYKMDYFEAQVSNDFTPILQHFFVKRGKLM